MMEEAEGEGEVVRQVLGSDGRTAREAEDGGGQALRPLSPRTQV